MPQMDRGIYRGIYSSLVDDMDFQLLSSKSRHVFLTLRLSEQAGVGCIFRFYYEPLQQQTGYCRQEIEESLVECESGKWIKREGPIVWIVNGLRYSPNTKVKSPTVKKSLLKQVRALPKLTIVREFCEFYELEYPFEVKTYTPQDTLSHRVADTLPHTSNSNSNSRSIKSMRVGKPPADGSHPIKALLKYYDETYTRLHRERPVITGADAKAAETILKNRKPEVAERMVKSFLENPPDLFKDKALLSVRHILSAANTLLARREVSG